MQPSMHQAAYICCMFGYFWKVDVQLAEPVQFDVLCAVEFLGFSSCSGNAHSSSPFIHRTLFKQIQVFSSLRLSIRPAFWASASNVNTKTGLSMLTSYVRMMETAPETR